MTAEGLVVCFADGRAALLKTEKLYSMIDFRSELTSEYKPAELPPLSASKCAPVAAAAYWVSLPREDAI